jgi:membrane fusion protein, heavy metal efflux system
MSDMNETNQQTTVGRQKLIVVACVVIVAIVALVAIVLWTRKSGPSTRVNVNAEISPAAEQHEGEEVKLSAEALQSAGIEIEGVTQRPAVALLQATGTIEANEQQTQKATPLVGGRVERVLVKLGDRVRSGAVLAVMSSPQIAQMHGKLHEAETQRALAERNLERVLRAENRVAVLSAKAKLDEAEATLKRVRRLIELGAGAGKDLIAAETAYKTAKAEYDFQSNISLNREVQEARAAVETARVDVSHIRDELRSLGAPVPEGERHDHNKDTSLVALRSPVSGAVTERLVNVGAGIEAGTSLFTIGDLSTVWIIANVPEAQIGRVHVGNSVEVSSAALGEKALSGRVAYIDPKLNEETRTARVRIEMTNPGERLKAGMFVQIGFQTPSGESTDQELVVKSEAVHRLGERTVVFVPKNESGHFEVRDVQIGGQVEGYSRVTTGLTLGDRVVTKGSFTLKSLLLKGQFGEEAEEEKKDD